MFINNNFYQTLFESNSIPDVYDINGYIDNKTKQKSIMINTSFCENEIYSFEFFPDYLNYNFLLPKYFKFKKVKQKLGFSIYLKNHSTINLYLKTECSAQHRKNISRAVNRLELSFNINYRTYFGEIPFEHYNFIMDRLKEMITNRFQQREGRNRTLENWDHIFEQTINLINSKKASLFVIYDKEKPIEISINYHVGSIIYSSISSYDLDYGRFSLGNIEIYKQLEWCLLNNIDLFDMGYGDFDYKRKWSNQMYEFENHIIYHKYNFLGVFYSLIKKYQFKIINYLISKKINDRIYGLYEAFKKNDNTVLNLEYKLIPLSSLPNESLYGYHINIDSDNYRFLRKPVYDYLYKYQEHIDNINLLQISKNVNSYIIQGKNSISKLIFEESKIK